MARTGRQRYDHLRALGISLDAARRWRADWFTATSPIHVEGVPDVLRPTQPFVTPAAQGGAQ
ncbi:TPA: hypothetical protein ACOECF_001320 [Stenotrophomonas maltophilia]